MKYSNTVEYNINTKLDSSGLTKLQAQIKQLENSMQQMSNRELLNSDKVQAAKTQLEGLNTALTNSFNSSLGILDLSKFRAELDAGGVSAKGLQSAFSMMGAEGQAALNGLTTQIANFNGGMERTSSQIDKIFTTFSNTFRWGFVSSFFSQFMNAIHSSVDYVKELDDSLTQIMLVTDYNRDSMNEFAKSANEAAKAVSMTTTGMTNASLIFAQQGYDLGQSQELATLSAKLANASQQDTATTSDQITAYMNAYGLQDSIEELTQQMDNWALIANVSAADVSELAQASQRAASMANAVGVSGEQLAAQIATIESITREAPEQIGNGLKTLYARFSDIASGKEDEDGFTLGKVTSQLNAIGVQVLDEMGQIRDVGDIMEDLMVIWDDLDQTSKVAASQALAGKYQVNRFMALMDNSSMYEEYKGATGSAATGTLDQMNEEFANSIEGRTAKLQASLEGLFSTIFNTDDIYPWMDAAQGAVDLLQQFFDALGGGKTVLLGITSLLTQAFSQNIARSINDTLANRELMQTRQRNIEGVNDTLDRVGIDRNSGIGQYISATAEQAGKGAINDAQYDTYMANVQNWIDAQTALTQSEEELQDTINALNMAYGKAVGENNAVFKDENGLNTQFANDERLNLNQDQINKIMSQADFSEAIAGARNFSNELQQVQAIQEKYNKSSKDAKEQLEQLYFASDKADMALEQLYNTGVISDDMFNDMKNAIAKVVVDLEDSGQATDQTEQELNELIATMGRFVKTAENMDASQLKKTLLNGAEEVQKKQTTRDFNQTQVDRADENAQESRQNIGNQQNVKEILDTFNAVQQLTFAWQAFQNLGSLWANEDLSTGEKVLQTIMNLTMAMPQLITAMQTLQGNSFLQNLGGGFLDLFNGNSIADKIRIGDEALPKLLELKKAAGQLTPELERIGKMGEAGIGQLSKPMQEVVIKGMAAKDSLNKMGDALEQQVKEGKEAAASAGIFSKVLVSMRIESEAGSGALAILKTGFATLKTEIGATMASLGPFLLVGAAIAAVAIAIGKAQEQAKEAHDQAIADFEDAKKAQEQVADLSAKMDDWKFKRQENGNSKELAEEADALANSLRELGQEEEANKLHIAAMTAAVTDSAAGFNNLEKAIDEANQKMLDQSALDSIEKANEVLKDRLSTEEEINAALELRRNAALDYNLSQLSQANGSQMGILNAPGDRDLRAATADWQSIDSILKQTIPEYAEIIDENERLALALSHTSDEAQRAAIQIQQLLNSHENLSEGQKGGITQLLESSGLSAETNLKLLASIDEDASAWKIKNQLQDMIQRINDGERPEVVIQANMTEDEKKDFARNQLSTYEPLDEDVDQGDFQSLTDTFYENEDRMGEEGTPFEDYSENLLKNADALADVVESILRYNDAVESLDKNYDSWKDTLENSNELSDAHIHAVQELQETYSDFLGLTGKVSKNFAKNTANLELMQEAAEGTEGAYEDLQKAAAADIYMQVTGIEDLEKAQEEIQKVYDAFNKDNFDINALDVGDVIDFSSLPNAREAINEFLQDFTGSAEEAAALVKDAFGIDISPEMFVLQEQAAAGMNGVAANAGQMAETVHESAQRASMALHEGLEHHVETKVTSKQDTKTDDIVFTDLEPVQTEGTTITGTMPTIDTAAGVVSGPTLVDGPTWEAKIPGVGYKATQQHALAPKSLTGFAEDTTVKDGPGQGKITLSDSATGTRAPTGISKSNTGSRPSTNDTSGGGRSRGNSCFVAGTLISTSLGFKPIEQIQKGDMVLSYNEQIEFNEYSEVLQTMIHDTVEPIYTLYIKNEQLRVTGIHRFFVVDKITCGVPQWVHAADLHVGQWVLFADGTWHVIHKIEVNIEHQTVYNFEVSHNHNYYVGCNQILAHNKRNPKTGGGKTKKIEPKEKKKHEKDYYEEVNSQLEKTEEILSKIEKEEDRLIGDKARANQAKQLKLLEKEITLNKEKLKIQKQELKDIDARMKKEDKQAEKTAQKGGVNAAIPNAIYDEDGVIQNYEQISKAIDKIHNKLIEKYNAAAAAGNEELAKEIEKTIQKFDKYGESLLKDAQRHNDLQSEIEGTIGTLEDLEDAIEDVRIAAFKAHQEAMDNLTDLRKDAAEINTLFRDFDEDGFLTGWSLDTTPIDNMIESMYNLDHTYGMTEKDAKSFYDTLIAQEKEKLKNTTDKDERAAIKSTIKYYQGEKKNISPESLQNGELGMWTNEMDRIEGWINGTNKEPNPFGEDEAAMWEAYQTAYEHALQAFKNQREEAKKLRDSIVDAWEAQDEALQDNLSQFDRISDHLERIGNTYALYYGEDSYDGILKIMDQQGNNLEAQYAQLKEAHKYWANQYNKAVESGDEELIKKTRKLMDDAEDAMYDKAEELAEHWVERYEKAVDASIQKIETKLWGTTGKDKNGNYTLGLEDQTMAWELQKDYMQTYKDDVEKAYEIDKLRSKYNNLLNDASGMSLQVQNKIRAQMQEQLDLLASQKTMSEYDVKLANAKLEILQKQIALEDAQRNKNKMQLRRDTQGNYRYVYRANEGDVQKAQDELNESQYDAYEMTKEQTIANNDRAISLYQDYMNKMRDIENKYKDDKEAMNAAMAALTTEYGKLLGALQEDFTDTTNGMYDVLCWMVENSTEDTSTAAMNMLDQLYDKNGEVKENTGNDWRDLATKITEEVLPNINEAVAEGIGNISNEAEDLKKKLVGDNGVMTDIGSSTGELDKSMQKALETTTNWKEETENLFKAFTKDNKHVQEAMNKLKEMEKQLKTNQKATSELAKKYKKANQLLQEKTAESLNYKVKAGEEKVKVGDVYTLKKGTEVFYDNHGDTQQDENGKYSFILKKDIEVEINADQSPAPLQWSMYPVDTKAWGSEQLPESDGPKTRKYQGWHLSDAALKKAIKADSKTAGTLQPIVDTKKFDTGGYTGNWTDNTSEKKNGKLAFLHQKELILNAKDTENILSAVKYMRDLVSNQLQTTSLAGVLQKVTARSGDDVIEQRVEIQASFPNATDADDIRRALINLSDNAYQYSYRTR